MGTIPRPMRRATSRLAFRPSTVIGATGVVASICHSFCFSVAHASF